MHSEDAGRVIRIIVGESVRLERARLMPWMIVGAVLTLGSVKLYLTVRRQLANTNSRRRVLEADRLRNGEKIQRLQAKNDRLHDNLKIFGMDFMDGDGP